MNKERFKNFTLIEGVKPDIDKENETPEKAYQSNPLKTDLYSRLAAFRNSQRKFDIKDVIKDSLK